MRFIILIAAMFLFASSANAAASEENLIDLDEALLAKPLDVWFKPETCAQNVGEYFYISLGHKDVSVFKIKRSIYRKASLSSWAAINQDNTGAIKGRVKKNTGCPENPMSVLQIFISAPDGAVDTAVDTDIFMLRLDGNQSHDASLVKLRDSGQAKEVNKGLLYFAGDQTLGGVKKSVAYLMAKDPKDLQKSGGPMRARCLEGKTSGTLACSVIDAINTEAVYEALLPVWPPKLEDIHKLHSQMESFVEILRVK